MKYQSLSIRTRLTLAFSALTLLVVTVAGLSLAALSSANGRFTSYTDGINARATTATAVRTAVDRRAIAARNLVLVTKPADLAIEKAEVLKSHQDVQASLKKLNTMIASATDSTPKARALIAEIDRVERAYGPVALDIVDLALKGQHNEAIAKMNEQCRPLLAALVAASQEYGTYTAGRAVALTADAGVEFATQRAVLIVACLVALIAAVLSGAFMLVPLNSSTTSAL